MRVARCTSKVKQQGQRLWSATIHSFGPRGVAFGTGVLDDIGSTTTLLPWIERGGVGARCYK